MPLRVTPSLTPRVPRLPPQVSQLVGMAPLKAFLAELNAKVTYVTRTEGAVLMATSPTSTTHRLALPFTQVTYVERGGAPRLLEGCLNVVLTGAPWDASRTQGARAAAAPSSL